MLPGSSSIALLPVPAFLGYKPDYVTGTVMVRVCAWCPTKREAELEAARMGARVTHDICPTCSAKLIAQVTGDRTE